MQRPRPDECRMHKRGLLLDNPAVSGSHLALFGCLLRLAFPGFAGGRLCVIRGDRLAKIHIAQKVVAPQDEGVVGGGVEHDSRDGLWSRRQPRGNGVSKLTGPAADASLANVEEDEAIVGCGDDQGVFALVERHGCGTRSLCWQCEVCLDLPPAAKDAYESTRGGRGGNPLVLRRRSQEGHRAMLAHRLLGFGGEALTLARHRDSDHRNTAVVKPQCKLTVARSEL
mmetsp:Transcript_72629/g.170847  ORF Transcript_72629/g.170847 Transcript_72629/m.170847 type:complete len:226 (-) Transcript_72629:685-1362(-)